jgi:diamine N-acetyltransferase
MSIRKVLPSETEVLSHLCNQIYKQYFLYLWTDNGEWYMNKVYNAAQLKSEIENENSEFYFYLFENKPVGYLKINLNKELEGDKSKDCLEVERIYFLQEFAGKGLGKEVMNFAFEIAQTLNKDYVFLKLMDSSHNSKAFYEKMGFQLCGTAHLDFERMFPKYRGMLVMKKEL